MKNDKNIKKLKINAIEIDEQKQKRRDYQKQYMGNITDERNKK